MYSGDTSLLEKVYHIGHKFTILGTNGMCIHLYVHIYIFTFLLVFISLLLYYEFGKITIASLLLAHIFPITNLR